METYTEYKDTQLPAIKLLRKLDYNYISPEVTKHKREKILSNVILEDILAEQLKKINSFEFKREKFKFSANNILAAVNAIKNVPDKN